MGQCSGGLDYAQRAVARKDDSIPGGRVRRTAKVGQAIGASGAHYAGTRARNVARSKEAGAVELDKRHLEAAATMKLAEVSAPAGITFLDDPEETVIATITIPTEEPEEPEVEEETELVGEGEAAEGEAAEAQAEGATADEADAGAGAGGEES